MAGDLVEISLPKTQYNERSSFTATAYVRTQSTAASATPTTAEYKIVNLTTGQTMVDWTSLTPAGSMTITVPAAANAIQQANSTRLGGSKTERVQLLVSIDRGLTTEHLAARTWTINNHIGR